MEKKRLSIEELEKMTHSNLVCTIKISLQDETFGDDKEHIMELEVFDGFAHCHDCDGSEYFMNFPKLCLINKSDSFKKTIREFMELPENSEITVTDVMTSYYELVCNGSNSL